MHPVPALRELDGLALWSELARRGVARGTLLAAVRDGRVTRPFRGTYALPGVSRAAAAARRLRGYASHTTAAAYWGLEVVQQRLEIHVTVPDDRRRRRDIAADVRLHRCDLDPHDTVTAPVPVTRPLRTVLDCARVLPLVEAVVVADAALRHGLDPEHLTDAASRLRGPGAGRVRRAASLTDPRCESPLETLVRVPLVLAGFDVRSQVIVRSADRSMRVDLVIERWNGRRVSVVIEADGAQFHATPERFRSDRARRRLLAQAGFVVVELTYTDVWPDPTSAIDAVRAVVQQRWMRAG